MAKSHALSQVDVQATMIKIIKTEMKVGLTFADIALQTYDRAKRQRNRTNARLAYDTVMRYCKASRFSDEDEREIQSCGARLKAALQQLGESV